MGLITLNLSLLPHLALSCQGTSIQYPVCMITCQNHHLLIHPHLPSPHPLPDQPSLLTSEELKEIIISNLKTMAFYFINIIYKQEF